jgi:hypothetical protein
MQTGYYGSLAILICSTCGHLLLFFGRRVSRHHLTILTLSLIVNIFTGLDTCVL